MTKTSIRKSQSVRAMALCCCLFLAATIICAQSDDLTPTERRASPTVQYSLRVNRNLIRARRLSFRVGLTSVSERTLKELTGDIIEPNIKQIAQQQNLVAAKFLNIQPNQLLNIDLSKI